jgi:hypothetical protein
MFFLSIMAKANLQNYVFSPALKGRVRITAGSA